VTGSRLDGAQTTLTLYLMHENLMISTVIKLGELSLPLPGFIYPLLPLSVLSAMAYLVARYLEPGVKQMLQRLPLLQPA